MIATSPTNAELKSCSRDPIGFRSKSFNLYQLVRSRPLTFIDPLGLMDIENVNGGTKLQTCDSTNAVYAGIWVKLTPSEKAASRRAGGGHLVFTDDVRVNVWNCNPVEEIVNFENQLQWLMEIDGDGGFLTNNAGNPDGQYKQCINWKVSKEGGFCTKGKVSGTFVVKLFVGKPPRSLKNKFYPPNDKIPGIMVAEPFTGEMEEIDPTWPFSAWGWTVKKGLVRYFTLNVACGIFSVSFPTL